jgi:hypothetical protein
MQITLTDKRAKELAKNLRARLPKDPGQRRTLDILAEALGHSSYGALKSALAAETSQPDLKALPPLLQAIDRTPVVNAYNGAWIWQQFADVRDVNEITRVLGLEVAVRALASDPGASAADFDERLDRYYENRIEHRPRLSDWQPTPPEGEGWVLAGLREPEEREISALFVRAPQGDLPESPAPTAPDEVYVVIIEGDDDKFVWAALDREAAHESAQSYIADTMGETADTPYDVVCAPLLGAVDGDAETASPVSELTRERVMQAFLAAGERDELFSGPTIEALDGREFMDLEARLSAALQAAFDAAPAMGENARTSRTILAEWLDPNGNLVEGASGPIHEVLPRTARFLEAMAADGLAAHVRLHGRDRTLSDADLVAVAPATGTIEHPWFGYAEMAYGPSGHKVFQTRFALPDWRGTHEVDEAAGPAFTVMADYVDTGIRFTFEHADGTLQEMMLENAGGRPKINTWSEFEQDSDAIVLIERDGTLVTAGAGDASFKFVAGGDVRRAPAPEI